MSCCSNVCRPASCGPFWPGFACGAGCNWGAGAGGAGWGWGGGWGGCNFGGYPYWYYPTAYSNW